MRRPSSDAVDDLRVLLAVLLAFRRDRKGTGSRLPTHSDAFLVFLGIHPEGASVLELREFFGIGQSRTTRTCQALQRQGTVMLRRATDDRRKTIVRLTAQGQRILDEANSLLREGVGRR
jgi:DNA-binding MarR family transcriptional regulator